MVNVADRFNNQGPKRRTSSVHISFVDASNSVKRLYQVQVLMTFLKRMLFLQRGYFDLYFLLTITADLDSCIHNVHWAVIQTCHLYRFFRYLPIFRTYFGKIPKYRWHTSKYRIMSYFGVKRGNLK